MSKVKAYIENIFDKKNSVFYEYILVIKKKCLHLQCD